MRERERLARYVLWRAKLGSSLSGERKRMSDDGADADGRGRRKGRPNSATAKKLRKEEIDARARRRGGRVRTLKAGSDASF